MSYDWTPPENYWIISAGTNFRVTQAIAHRVSDEWERGDKILVFCDLSGGEIRVPASAFYGIWESTPEQRARDSAMQKMLEGEEFS